MALLVTHTSAQNGLIKRHNGIHNDTMCRSPHCIVKRVLRNNNPICGVFLRPEDRRDDNRRGLFDSARRLNWPRRLLPRSTTLKITEKKIALKSLSLRIVRTICFFLYGNNHFLSLTIVSMKNNT